MCSWRRVAVARVFALVVRCRVMMLLVYSRVGKNRDTRRGSPAGAGAGRTADHLAFFFSQKILAVRSANCIYRPVTSCAYFINSIRTFLLSFSHSFHSGSFTSTCRSFSSSHFFILSEWIFKAFIISSGSVTIIPPMLSANL